MDHRESASRTRRACESCRRKKTACPAERPRCSLCMRLDQECVYLPRDLPLAGRHDAKEAKFSSSRKPTRRPGSQIETYINLHPFTKPTGPHRRPSRSVQKDWQHFNSYVSFQPTSDLNALVSAPPRWTPSKPEPPRQALEHFGKVYRTKIYFQPLPLFNPLSLVEQLEVFPQYLRWSFLALTLHYTTHPFYDGTEAEAIEFYSKEAQRTFSEHETAGLANVEIVQTMCNLALCSLLSEKPRAWVDLRSTGRMEALRIMMLSKQPHTTSDDGHSRCYWSILLLEDTFTPQFNTIRRLCNPPPETPKSPQVPMFAFPGFSQGLLNDLPGDDALIDQEGGINTLCFDAVTFWSEVAAYLRDVRSGKLETPWLITSTFQRLTAKAFELEANIGQAHLVRSVHLECRSAAEIQRHHEYWAAWIYMQVASHAAMALLNHPFIHLVVLRKHPKRAKPYLFLQQTIDQAIYHSGWVARLLDRCNSIGLAIQSPFLGYAAASVATVAWYFQYATDPTVSKVASDSMTSIKRYLDLVSVRWSCIKPKLYALKVLQDVADRHRPQASADQATVTFEPSKLWQLLDSRLTLPSPEPVDLMSSSSEDSSSMITVRVTTKLMQPLFEEQTEVLTSSAEPALDLAALHNWSYVPEDIFPNSTDEGGFLAVEVYQPDAACPSDTAGLLTGRPEKFPTVSF